MTRGRLGARLQVTPPPTTAWVVAAAFLLAAAGAPPGVAGQADPTEGSRLAATDSARLALCRDAGRFVTEQAGMVARSEPDTVDDWRTKQRVAGCRVTAAGLTRRSLQAEAQRFFERVRAAGWVRTPDPRDAPNEASLRFRMSGADCLFSFYSGGLLGTQAEGEVDDLVVPGPGERRYNFLVLCIPAMPAAPRGVSRRPARRLESGAPAPT